MVEGEGFEPSKTEVNGFTARPIWPLWYPSKGLIFYDQYIIGINVQFNILKLYMQKKTEGIWIGGKHSVLLALQSKKNRVLEIVIKNSSNAENIDKIHQDKIKIKELSFFNKIFRKDEVNHQGFAARIITQHLKFDDLKRNIGKFKTAILLEKVYDYRNIGSILRSAYAFGIDTMIVEERNFNLNNPLMYKTSSGAINFVNIYTVKNIKHAINELKKNNFYLYSIQPKGNVNLNNVKFEEKIALIFGSEDKGLRESVSKLSDYSVKIPMKNNIESLNLSNASSIVFYEVYKKKPAE